MCFLAAKTFGQRFSKSLADSLEPRFYFKILQFGAKLAELLPVFSNPGKANSWQQMKNRGEHER